MPPLQLWSHPWDAAIQPMCSPFARRLSPYTVSTVVQCGNHCGDDHAARKQIGRGPSTRDTRAQTARPPDHLGTSLFQPDRGTNISKTIGLAQISRSAL